MYMTASIFACIFFIILLLVTGMHPERTNVSHFELKRRASGGDKEADDILIQEGYHEDAETFLRLTSALLLVVTILLSVVSWGWVVGVIVGVLVVLCYGAIARTKPVRQVSKMLYRRISSYVIWLVQRISPGLRVLRDYTPQDTVMKVSSKEELLHIAKESVGVLSANERQLLVSGLTFSDRLVSEVMTPRSVVDTVKKTELLGPLTLDELYKTGHSRLPVIDGDIDHIIGVLYIQDLLTATSRKTPTAAEAMESKVFYIREDHTLQHALSAFLRTHHHLFIVVNEYRETVGVVSLEDVIEALLGRKIDDEFDAHSDLRAVAERNVRGNNSPKSHTDV